MRVPKTKTVHVMLCKAAKELQPRTISCPADAQLGRLEAEMLLARAINRDRAWMVVHGDAAVSARARKAFQTFVQRRKQHEPIAYLIGEKEFYGLPFQVNRRVLIPRPETELLVDLALHQVGAMYVLPLPTVTVWDVGTGSGCVAIAIAKHLPLARVLATDVSREALVVAKRNAKRHDATHVTFLKARLLDAHVRRWLAKHEKLPLTIVANLPYLPSSDKGDAKRASPLQPDVVNYEPHAALFSGKTGLEVIEKFLRQLATFWEERPNVSPLHVFLEFDPPQAKRLITFVKKLFPHAMLNMHKDLAGRKRVLEIQMSTRDPARL